MITGVMRINYGLIGIGIDQNTALADAGLPKGATSHFVDYVRPQYVGLCIFIRIPDDAARRIEKCGDIYVLTRQEILRRRESKWRYNEDARKRKRAELAQAKGESCE